MAGRLSMKIGTSSIADFGLRNAGSGIYPRGKQPDNTPNTTLLFNLDNEKSHLHTGNEREGSWQYGVGRRQKTEYLKREAINNRQPTINK